MAGFIIFNKVFLNAFDTSATCSKFGSSFILNKISHFRIVNFSVLFMIYREKIKNNKNWNTFSLITYDISCNNFLHMSHMIFNDKVIMLVYNKIIYLFEFPVMNARASMLESSIQFLWTIIFIFWKSFMFICTIFWVTR